MEVEVTSEIRRLSGKLRIQDPEGQMACWRSQESTCGLGPALTLSSNSASLNIFLSVVSYRMDKAWYSLAFI